MSVRRKIIALLVTVLAAGAWSASAAAPAQAGGPTSVLMTNPATGRAHALYYSDRAYERLASAVGGFGAESGSAAKPQSVVDDFGSEIRLTWLIHDMSIWRIDRVHITAKDGTWIETVVDGRWRGHLRPRRILASRGRSAAPHGLAESRRSARRFSTSDWGPDIDGAARRRPDGGASRSDGGADRTSAGGSHQPYSGACPGDDRRRGCRPAWWWAQSRRCCWRDPGLGGADHRGSYSPARPAGSCLRARCHQGAFECVSGG